MTEKKESKETPAQIALTITIILVGVAALSVILAWGVTSCEDRREAAKEDRKHECALRCIPDDVAACPSHGDPVCATSDPWPDTYVAGNRPKTFWQRSRDCEASCKDPEKCEAACKEAERYKK